MKTWLLNHKEISIIGGALLLSLWLFFHFIPKQDCLSKIAIGGSSNFYMIGTDDDNLFKTRNEALDYCMAQRWGFL